MSIVSFSMFLAMVGDAFEAAKARGKAKRGLDPLLVQIVLQTRKLKMKFACKENDFFLVLCVQSFDVHC